MGELSITVTIANRPYKVTIETEEEEKVRKAVKIVNDRINEYSNLYAFKDKQDLLAMVSLQYAKGVVDYEIRESIEKKKSIGRLLEIDELITDYLSKE